jgi:hypothetical protein
MGVNLPCSQLEEICSLKAVKTHFLELLINTTPTRATTTNNKLRPKDNPVLLKIKRGHLF